MLGGQGHSAVRTGLGDGGALGTRSRRGQRRGPYEAGSRLATLVNNLQCFWLPWVVVVMLPFGRIQLAINAHLALLQILQVVLT